VDDDSTITTSFGSNQRQLTRCGLDSESPLLIAGFETSLLGHNPDLQEVYGLDVGRVIFTVLDPRTSHSAPLFHSSKAILEEPPIEKEDERCTAYFMATTSCFYIYFSLITTSCQQGGPLLPLRSEPESFGFPAGRTIDDHQVPGLQGMQTMTDVALVPWQGPHEVLMTARD
jgi:hypothetical protein